MHGRNPYSPMRESTLLMTKLLLFYLCLTWVLLPVSPVSAQGTSQKAERPNIILVMADDQGWGDMGYYNHPYVRTPNFDEMSRNALRFDHFYAAAPVCSPTRASVLTGRNPNRVNVLNHGLSMRPQETTIAEALKTVGYVTGHFGKWHVGSCQPTSPVNPTNSGFDVWLSTPNFFDLNPVMSRNGVAEQMEGESSMIAVDAALDFIRDQVELDRPFLSIIWFGSPHSPFDALEEDKQLYEGKPMAEYYREITAMDRAFGKLRNELRSLGIADNTLLWYSSDNGGLNEQTSGGREKKGSIYEGGLRVPAMIEWPASIPEGRITDVVGFTSDIYPTLVELTGAKIANQYPLDGISLVDVIDGKMESRDSGIGFWRYPYPGRLTYADRMMIALMEAQRAGHEFDPEGRLDLDAGEIKQQFPEDEFPGHAAWLEYPWKLHRIIENDRERFELYNLESDPEEARDVWSTQSERVKRMEASLADWQTAVMRSLNGKDY